MKHLIYLTLIILAFGCNQSEVELDGVVVTLVSTSDDEKEVQITSSDKLVTTITLSENRKVKRVINPTVFGAEVIGFDTTTGNIATKVINDPQGEIQKVAYNFRSDGLLRGAYQMRDGKNEAIGFLYKDGMNSLEAVFVYDSLGKVVETRKY